MLSTRIVQRPWTADSVMKNINFGMARGLTRTAKDGQSASKGAIKGTFTTRGTWFEQNMRHGIKVKPATPRDLSAEVHTLANWLEKHETGKDKTAQGGSVAVPTDQIRRNKRLIIPRAQRPRGLAGKAFVLQTKKGKVLAQRITRGKRKGIIILYGLEPKVRIRKQSTFYEPIRKVVKRRGPRHVDDSIRDALRTMR